MIVNRSPVRRIAAALALSTLALGAAACGDDGSSNPSGGHHMTSSPSPSVTAEQQHNAQDVAFAQGMIPHHRQAVVTADLAATRADSQAVKDLAARIKQAQDPEITTMSGWLTSWGEQVPADDTMHGMDHSTHGMPESGSPTQMPGMMSDADMTKLEKLSGAAFDTEFLKLMIVHHEGAITMAKTEQAQGAFPPAKELAGAIITAQSTEIAQMKKLLAE